MAKQHDKQFKLDAVRYYLDHKELGVRGCAQNLGVGYSTLTKWLKDFRESGDIPVRGSGNYASDEQKEIARLKRELRDAGVGEMTVAVFQCVAAVPGSALCGSCAFLLHEIHYPRGNIILGNCVVDNLGRETSLCFSMRVRRWSSALRRWEATQSISMTKAVPSRLIRKCLLSPGFIPCRRAAWLW